MQFTNILINWYLANKRDLPWRETNDPYAIWLSEIILQQTRVAQGMPYFYSFLDAFPTVFDLANAQEEQVLKLWQGLGYYSRARNLHKTAQYIATENKGIFPPDYAGLLQLKGVGEYTAAAIASFCYNEAVPVVDGNVFRVLSRYFDVETDISSSGAKKEFRELAAAIMPADNAALFNQAIMEFGALQCVPKSPNCTICVMNESCIALQKKKVALLPVKTKKTKVVNRYFDYLVFRDVQDHTIIHKREAKGIWHNLYEFPVIESVAPESTDGIAERIHTLFGSQYDITSVAVHTILPIVHKLSHQHLSIRFWEVSVKGELVNGMNYEDLVRYPFPIVIINFIEKEYNLKIN